MVFEWESCSFEILQHANFYLATQISSGIKNKETRAIY